MSARQQERYYWLKLPNDFFDNHTLRILRGVEGGQYALLLYIELLAESVTRDGRLRCSEKVAYDESMIASMFGFSVEQVKLSFSLLKKFELMAVEKDGTLVFPNLKDMVGSETNDAERKRKSRAGKASLEDFERTTEGQSEDKERTKGGKCPIENRDKSTENRDKKERESSLARSREASEFDPKYTPPKVATPTWEEVFRVVKGQVSKDPITEDFARQWFETSEMSEWRDTKGQDFRQPYLWKRKLRLEWNEELKQQRERNGNGKTDADLKRDQEAADEWSRRCLVDESED